MCTVSGDAVLCLNYGPYVYTVCIYILLLQAGQAGRWHQESSVCAL